MVEHDECDQLAARRRRRWGQLSAPVGQGFRASVRGALLLLVACAAWHSSAVAYAGEPGAEPGEVTQAASPTPARVRGRSLYCDPPTFCCPGPPVFGYDGGFHLSDRRRRFTLQPGAFTQLRWTFDRRTEFPPGEERDTHDFEFARTRLRVRGDLTRLFDYDFMLNIDDTGDTGILVASLQWNAGKRWGSCPSVRAPGAAEGASGPCRAHA